MKNFARFRSFVQQLTRLIEKQGGDEGAMLADGESLLRELVAHDDWLPDALALPSSERYRQYLLHCDPLERFSVVSFVWMPGQKTPIHDHTVWGLVGVMRGEEHCEEFGEPVVGQPFLPRAAHAVRRGQIDRVSPAIGDIHVVSNAGAQGPSVSIHVYGGNIGAIRRHTFDPASGEASEFISGYDNDSIPNWWER
jgi:predicted metal-dependent enzyme (double-stranded beta helix superfamily)